MHMVKELVALLSSNMQLLEKLSGEMVASFGQVVDWLRGVGFAHVQEPDVAALLKRMIGNQADNPQWWEVVSAVVHLGTSSKSLSGLCWFNALNGGRGFCD